MDIREVSQEYSDKLDNLPPLIVKDNTLSNATQDRLISARLSTEASVLEAEGGDVGDDDVKSSELDTDQTDHDEPTSENRSEKPAYQTVVKLITGSLLDDCTFERLYTDLHDGGDGNADNNSSPLQQETSTDVCGEQRVPTLQGIVRLVTRDQGKYLDEKQYMMYEILTYSFLLSQVRQECGENHDLALEVYISGALVDECTRYLTAVIKELQKRGGCDQLIMFTTGLAGAGKSTGIKVAQRFCFEFCRAVGITWNDDTFLFTAYTGSAAVAFGGKTTSKSIFFNKKRLSDDDQNFFSG
ncbi:hypothetical protein ACHAWF_001831, partial [Thalassiosira exigua]